MKTKIFSLLTGATLLAGFASCSDEWNPDPEGKGQGRLATSTIGVEVNGAETVVSENTGAKKVVGARVASRADVTPTITLDNFIVTVTTTSGTQVEQWAYKDMPELPVFTAGDYIVSVKSHNVEPAAWNAPYYEGSQSFTIVADKVTEVETVVCTLANIRVSVNFSDNLLKAFDNADEVTVKVTSEGNNSLTFTPAIAAAGNSGYFAALDDLETLRVDFSASINGNVEKFTKTIDNVAKGQHRKINLGLTSNDNLPPEEVGTITNDGDGITIDSEVVEDEPIISNYDWFEDNLDDKNRPGNEDFEDPEQPGGEDPVDPSEETISFTSDNLDLDGWNDCANYGAGKLDAIVVLHSDNGFAHLNVEIVSDMLTHDFLSGVGLDNVFDLAEPGDLAEGLTGLGFPTGEEVTGDGITSLDFNITNFVPLILESGDHKFVITVTDKKGATKSMTLKLRKS